MQSLDKKQKIDVLLKALEERYKVLHTIRDRVQNICLWVLGLLLAAGGWLLQEEVVFNPLQKIICIVALVSAFYALRFKFLTDLQKGFKSQQSVSVRLERALGLYKTGVFDEVATPLYPEKWEYTGGERGEGEFFTTTFLLLYIGVGFLISVILLSGIDPGDFLCHFLQN